MNNGDKVIEVANKLENILCTYLDCGNRDFRVKANGYLTEVDWKSPISFALGYCYAKSNENPDVKEKINEFLGNRLEGQSIGDIVKDYKYYCYESQEQALEYIDEILRELKQILYSEEI